MSRMDRPNPWSPGHCRDELLQWIDAEAESTLEIPAEAILHARSCDRCSDLVPFLEPVPAAPVAAEPPAGWTDRLLDRTAMDRCETALHRLLDTESEDPERQTAASHLRHCSECSRTMQAWAQLQVDLPQALPVDPGEAFTRRVLVETSERATVSASWMERAFAQLEAWRSRPRFAMEFAYVGAALVWLIVGGSGIDLGPAIRWIGTTPSVAFGEAGRGAGVLSTAVIEHAEQRVSRIASERVVGKALDDLGARYKETEPSRRKIVEAGGEFVDALGDADLSRGSSMVGELSRQLSRLPGQFLQEPQTQTETPRTEREATENIERQETP